MNIVANPGMRTLSRKRSSIVSVLEIGSTKTCCLIAKLRPMERRDDVTNRTHSVDILGYGYQRSRGIRSGLVVDLEAAEDSIRRAVAFAERMSGITIESVILSLSAGRLGSRIFSSSVDLDGQQVRDRDLTKILAAGSQGGLSSDRRVIHALPIGYTLDHQRGIKDPRGMVGKTLGAEMHLVSADAAPIRNLELAVQRCHLDIETMVAAPFASGLSSLMTDEMEMGVACIDMGGGTTTISIFSEGQLVHTDALAVGGHHVTLDIARGLSIRLQEAERLKTLHGSAFSCSSDAQNFISISPVGEEDNNTPLQVPRSALIRIIRPRIEETLEFIRDRLLLSGFADQVGKRLVLTGGAAQLPGVPEVARHLFGRTVRLGRPLGIAGLPESARGPVFSTAAGLLVYPQVGPVDRMDTQRSQYLATGTGGYFSRVSRWLRESF